MKRILIIDDEPNVLETVVTLLKQNDYEAIGASSGEEGLKQIKESRFELIILDVNMPILNGLDVLKVIRKTTGHKDIPVLIMTSISVLEDVEKAYAAGANDYLVKPFDIKRLLRKVKSLLGEKLDDDD